MTHVLSLVKDRGVIPYSQKGNVGNKKSEDITRYKIVRPNDIVVNSMNVIIGSVGLSRYTGCLSPVYYVLTRRSEFDEPRYLNAYFQTKPFQLSLVRLGKGILAHRMRIPMDLLKCELFPRPPLPEQAAIVRYLDHHDRLIGRYIRAKEKLVALLQEQKQAIIHRAVTRGLNPNVRLKPSGVEWLGDVPEHWDVVPLKRIAWLKSGAGFPVAEQGQAGLELPFYKVSDMNRFGNERLMSSCGNAISRQTAIRLGATIFPPGTIVFPKVGGAMLTNKRRVLEHPSCIDNNLMGCVISSRDMLDYVLLLLHQIDLGMIAKPGPVPAVSEGEVREIRVVLPPLAKQAAIVLYLDKATVGLNIASAAARREIELLREYRTRLIADVVTGKLDVREATAQLPDLDAADEPDPDDESDAEEANV